MTLKFNCIYLFPLHHIRIGTFNELNGTTAQFCIIDFIQRIQ